jgi:hypothetical protein
MADDVRGLFGRALYERIEAEFRNLTAAFDAALAEPTPRALDDLRAATDGLMRAAAGIRLAVERAAQVREVPKR